MKLYEKVIIWALFPIILGCSNPTKKFDGDYKLNADATLGMNVNLTLKQIQEDLHRFTIDRGIIRCGKGRIREWDIIESKIDGNKLSARAMMYIDREIIIERAIMHEDVDDIANYNKFEEEISLEFTKENLIFCNWLPNHGASKVCSVFFRG